MFFLLFMATPNTMACRAGRRAGWGVSLTCLPPGRLALSACPPALVLNYPAVLRAALASMHSPPSHCHPAALSHLAHHCGAVQHQQQAGNGDIAGKVEGSPPAPPCRHLGAAGGQRLQHVHAKGAADLRGQAGRQAGGHRQG